MAPQPSVAENEVTVAIIGYRGVGKTTALNAILGNNFSFISDTKPTIGINKFRVLPEKNLSCATTNRKASRKAESISTEIMRDNRFPQRLNRKRTPKQKIFDVKSSDPSFASMDETPFYLVDIPGLNLTNPDCQYRDYIDESFMSFDAIILVLDCQTERKLQHRILKYLRRHLSRTKKIPLLIIGNERAAQIGDSSELVDLEVEVDEMFDIDSGDKVLQLDCIMSSFCVDMDCNGCDSGENDLEFGDESLLSKPIFIPVKLHDAFRYRLASAKLGVHQVSKLGQTVLDKICQDEIGKEAWETLNKDQKLEMVHSILSTPGDEYKLQETNFLKFMARLDHVLRDVPRHRLAAQNATVQENESSFYYLSNLFFGRPDQKSQYHNGDYTIEDLRDVDLGLADNLSEVSSRDSVLDKDRVEVSMMSSNTAFSDDTHENSAEGHEVVVSELQAPSKWRNKRIACILLILLLLLAIIFTVIFVLFGFAVASLD